MARGYQNPKKKLSQINSLIKNNLQFTPTKLVHNGKVITKPIDMANIANDYFTNKIHKIRDNFKNENRDPLDILKALIPRGKNELVIPLITMVQTKKLLKSFKASGSTGFDDLSSRTLKRCGDAIAPHLCHMINCIIRHSTFPSCFKITKIIKRWWSSN